jgi:adenine-specific DNA-methyltransferase
MYNRLKESKSMLSDNGCQIIAIDENEQNNLFSLNQDIFKSEIYDNVLIPIEHNKKGIQGDHFSYSSEFAIFSIPFSLKKINAIALPNEDWEWSNFRNWGGESLRTDAKNCFYPIKVNKMGEIVEFGEVSDDKFHPKSANVKDGDFTIIYPIDNEGIERKWRYAQDTVSGIKDRLKIESDSEGRIQIKIAKVSRPFKTMWYDTKYNAGDYGTKLLTAMGFKKGEFDFPKSINLVKDCLFVNDSITSVNIDYFAGSGTTGHAVIRLNKELDNGKGRRKYILTEMGKYFHSVTKVRIQKAIFSDKWANGKPMDIKGSLNHIFKYITLEQYEDALDAIEQFKVVTPKNLPLRYLYKPELNKINSTLDLSKPFGNKIKYGQPTKEGFVDLVDTYNYLQGYEVKTIKTYSISKKYYKVVETADTLVIWRDIQAGEDDSKAVIEIAEKYSEVSQIELNSDFHILATLKGKQLEIGKRILGVAIIHADIFNQ